MGTPRAGRPPVPTAMKRAAGNPGKRALNEREPQPALRLPPPPTWLSKTAKSEYRRVGKLLLGLGVMTEIDRVALAAYAVAYARWVTAEEQVAKLGEIVKSPNGHPIQNPHRSLANRAMDDMRRLLLEFGMTPASRTRVQTQGAGERDDLAELLGLADWDGEGVDVWGDEAGVVQ